MAEELIRTVGTEITLESNGSSTTNGSYTQADNNSVTSSNNGGYPYLLLYGSFTYATSPTANSHIKLYARNLNIISTNDAPVPQDDYRNQFLGHFILNDVTTTQYATCVQIIVERPHFDFDVYIKNEGGQTISAGWTLYCKPWTYEPSA